WLQDANYAKTSGYDADGQMTWNAAMTWADQLVYGGYDDWRLPTIVDTGTPGCNVANSGTDCGYNVQTADTGTNPVTVYSELAYMYYVNLGLKGYFDTSGGVQVDWGIFGDGTGGNGRQNNVGLINNLQSFVYWSGAEYTPNSNFAWYFNALYGLQNAFYKDNVVYAWAVRSGDVAVAPPSIPEPGSLALVGLGVIALGAARRRRG
ncbi:MAG: DUF1566 domain-containing protein, partial [Candidatus Competibacteraceae bacterium]|nr:DUF1566 domain-containing protein [Candidatus Competibacteraceae bacterium]